MPPSSPVDVPLPPLPLMERTGSVGTAPGAEERYLAIGEHLRDRVLAALPADVDLVGGRVLDFGCGAGRVLRHLLPLAEQTELHGIELDPASVDWVQEHLGHAVTAQLGTELPGLPYPDGHFDVVYALSVFTHLTEHWAGWLLECHRVLKPGGVLIATTLGAGMSEEVRHEPWRADRIGMHVSGAGVSWDLGGPIAFCSPWWLRAHWGRAFEILAPVGDPPAVPREHDFWTLRRREVEIDVAGLEAWEPDEPREEVAARHNLSTLWRELEQQREHLDAERRAIAADREHHAGVAIRMEEELAAWRSTAEQWQTRAAAIEAELGDVRERSADLQRRYDVLVASSSWRVTAPMRRLAAWNRRRRLVGDDR